MLKWSAGQPHKQNWVALKTGRPRLAFRQTAGICPLMPFETPCACSTLRRATRAVTAMYDAALAPSGLRITQFSVLSALARLGPLPVTRLAAEVALDRSTMGRNLDPLERRGLIRIKVGDVDQRERVAHLTAAGERAIEAALAVLARSPGADRDFGAAFRYPLARRSARRPPAYVINFRRCFP